MQSRFPINVFLTEMSFYEEFKEFDAYIYNKNLGAYFVTTIKQKQINFWNLSSLKKSFSV